MMNCNVPKRVKSKVKIKAPRENSISMISVAITYRLYYYYDIKTIKLKRIIKLPMLCSNPSRINMETILFNKIKNDTITTKSLLSNLKHKRGKIYFEQKKGL
jgi:hypothetical protein